MTALAFADLRALIRHHGERRGWRSQRQIAVMCGLDESALSRFLNGEQDIGARRTHALFQTIGVPVEQYDIAYALLGRAQEQARAARDRRSPEPAGSGHSTEAALSSAAPLTGANLESSGRATLPDLPASMVIARFAAGRFSGEQIAAFFAGVE